MGAVAGAAESRSSFLATGIGKGGKAFFWPKVGQEFSETINVKSKKRAKKAVYRVVAKLRGDATGDKKSVRCPR